MGLEGLFTWFMEQAKYILLIAMIALILITAAKRAWVAMAGALIGLAVVGVFIIQPEVIIGISEWLTGLLNLGSGTGE